MRHFRYEIALRQVDEDIGLAYWDSTLDQSLPSPKDSIMWSPIFVGNGDGLVKSGPFANWKTTTQLAGANGVVNNLYRQVGQSVFGGLYMESDIDFALSRAKYKDLTACVDPTFELTHGLP